MADKKISALTAATTPLAGTEVLPIVQSSTTVKVAVSDLTAGRAVSATSYNVSGGTAPANGIYLFGANTLGFSTNSSVRGVVDSSGNFAIGATSSAAARLNVSSSTTQDVVYVAANSAGVAADPVYVMPIRTAGSFRGGIRWNGSSIDYNTTSDARLKENIADADDTASLIDAIQVRKFDWKESGIHQRYGFIAQELAEVAPEAVSGDPQDTDMTMAVDYSKLVPMLVKEIQMLRSRVSVLEAKQ
jgi:hypothetical protein